MSFSDRLFGGPGGDLAKPSVATLFPASQVIVVLAVALIFRLVFWLMAADSAFLQMPVVDGSFFDIWARTLAEGRVFQEQPFFKPPLYAYLLAFFYRLGFGMGGVLVLQMLVGAFSCVLTLALGRILFRPRVALAGAVVAALLPILPFFETQLQAEVWTLALTLGSLLPVLLVLSGKVPPRGRTLALAGVLLGLAALGRPNLMLQVLVLAAGLWWWGRSNGRLGLGGVLPLLLGFALAIAPATLHNLKYGEFTLISANLGVNLYTGQSDAADGVSAIPVGVIWDDLQLRSQQAGAQGPAASSRFLTRETLGWMKDNPGRTAQLWFKKLVLVINGVEGRNNYNPLWLARHDGVVVLSRWWPATWLLMPFAIVGLIWAGRGTAPAWLLRWVVLSQAVAILPFFVNARFRAPLLPLLALFGAAGAVVALQSLRNRRWPVLGVLLVLAVAVNIDWYGLGAERWLARDHFNQGVMHTRSYGDWQPDPALAEQHFQRSLELDPEDVDANERYGAMLLSQAQPLVSRGRQLVEQGQDGNAARVLDQADALLGRAATLHRKATGVYPRSFRSWGNLGTCQMWQGDVAAARTTLMTKAGDQAAATRQAVAALNFYNESGRSLQAGLQINRAQQNVSRQLQMIWPAVMELPPLDPAITQVQQQLRERMESNR